MEILTMIMFFVFGYSLANIIRLCKIGKMLKELDVRDKDFSGKIDIIGKMNTLF
jgi:hypothetical protein